MRPSLSLILPANNEAEHIVPCLEAVMASERLAGDRPVQIIVVPNGCRDSTAEFARSFQQAVLARGWTLEVIELAKGSKLAALNAGEAAAQAAVLVYLDADVIVSPALLAQTEQKLSQSEAAYASGLVRLARAKTRATRAYARFYLRTPFMRQPAPGCGYFAMNTAGRARWAAWPDIISDDTFARLNFAADERHQLQASYDWPLVEGLRNLIRVRRRQNAGVDELLQRFPELMKNDAKTRFAPKDVLRAMLRHPFGTVVYGFVAMTVKLTPGQTDDWRRGR